MSLKNAIRKIAAPRLTMKQALEIFGLDPDSADDLDEKNLKKIYHKLIAKHHIDVIKGKIEAMTLVAKLMKTAGEPVEKIIAFTGLTHDEIENLKTNG